MYKIIHFLIYLFCQSIPLMSADRSSVKYSQFARDIESAYMTLFTKEFGYTLIGEKPVSMDERIENEYLSTQPHLLKTFYDSLQNTFKCSKKIIFKSFVDEDSFYWLEIIQKPAIKKCVSNNRKLQKFIKAKFGSEEFCYKKLEDPKTKIIDLLDGDAYLKGIILGYGESNAHYFAGDVL